jgi:hypothetical protein
LKDWSFLFNGLKVKKALKNAVLGNTTIPLLFDGTLKRFGANHPAIVYHYHC